MPKKMVEIPRTENYATLCEEVWNVIRLEHPLSAMDVLSSVLARVILATPDQFEKDVLDGISASLVSKLHAMRPPKH